MERETAESTRLVGRATEFTQLDQILKDVKRGRGRLVVLTGPSGVGKTALGEVFLRQFEAGGSAALALATRCVEDSSGQRPYGPFRDIVALLEGKPDETGLPTLLRKMAPGWLPGSPVSSRNVLFDQYRNLCRSIAQKRPLILFFDDLQWCDRSSLDLLAHIGSSLSSLSVLMLCTFEQTASEAAVSIRGITNRVGANAVELAIRPLESDAVGELAEEILGGSLGADLRDWLVEASNGLPLRTVHMSRWLRERGVIRKRLFRHAASARDLPENTASIKQIVLGRLDDLEPSTRWALEAAALSGSVVDSMVVAGQGGKKGEEILDHMRIAASRELIEGIGERQWAAGQRSVRFRFSHPVVRTLLQDRVTGKRREHLLTRAAEVLERLAGDGATEIADEIATLYLAGSAAEKAAEWALNAADLSERLFAVYEAEEFLQSAGRSGDDEFGRLGIEHRLAKLYAASGRELEAETMLTAVLSRARQLEDLALQVDAGTFLGWLQLESGADRHELSAMAGQLVDAARKLESPKELVMALDFACEIAERIGRAEEALLMAEEAFHVAKGSDEPEVVAQATYRLARVHVSWGSPEEARPLAERALKFYGELSSPGGVAVCHELLGQANFRAGNWDAALHHWESVLERMEAQESSDRKVAIKANIAELATRRGEFEHAMRLFDSALEMAQKIDDHTLVLRCQTGIARLEFERGEFARVLDMTDQIRAQLPESGAWKEKFLAAAIRALAYLELGDELQAWQEAARLEQLYRGKEGWFEHRAEGDAVRMRVIDLDSDTWLAGVVAQQGIGEAAEKDMYGEGFLQYHRACVQARERPKEARTAAERAVEVFEQLGADPMLGRTRRLLAGLPDTGAETAEPGDDQIDDNKIDKWFDSLEE